MTSLDICSRERQDLGAVSSPALAFGEMEAIQRPVFSNSNKERKQEQTRELLSCLHECAHTFTCTHLGWQTRQVF